MRNVFTAQSPAEAHLVAGLLEEEGIESVVEGEFLTGVRTEVPMDAATLPSVYVRDGDTARALALIAERGRTRDAVEGASEVALDDQLLEDQPGLVWFKRMLLAWVVFSIAEVISAMIGFIAWIAGARALPGPLVSPITTGVAIGVACAVAWLVVPLRRAPR